MKAILLLCAGASSVVAQTPVILSEARGVILSEAKDLPRMRPDLASVSPSAPGLGIASLLVMPFDKRLAAIVRQPALVENRTLQFGAELFDVWGGVGVFALSGSHLLHGQLTGIQKHNDLGRATARALLGGSLATGVLKMAFGRARPYVSADSNPRDFKFGRGIRKEDYRSLPSGHSTAAFAFASAWSRTPYSSPREDAVVYGLAGAVALTRVYKDKHWASDVLLGAAIGILAGNIAVRD